MVETDRPRSGELMSRAILHGAARSSAAYRVRIALQLKGISVDHVPYRLREGEQRSADFLRLNPAGLVPVFVTEAGDALTNSLAIIEYLEELQPEPPLLPRTALERARVRALAHAIACDIHPIQNWRVLLHVRQLLNAGEDASLAWGQHWIALGFGALEQQLRASTATGRCCHGDQPTLADVCLVPQVANARRFKLDLTAYPTLMRIAEYCEALPAFERARPENQPDGQ